ncbi:hypothetical protein HK098_007549 [Nowakowskiella sp. JEL0407]|nr:hypothetical protein HK098_007549 [Nowakowskiella sp. JEL0407]
MIGDSTQTLETQLPIVNMHSCYDGVVDNLPVNDAFLLIFGQGGSDILKLAHNKRESDALIISDWKENEHKEWKERTLTYMYKFIGPLVGKAFSPTVETQIITKAVPDEQFIVEAKAKYTQLLHTDSFRTQTKYILTAYGPNATKIEIGARCVFVDSRVKKPPSNSLKKIIEVSVIAGIRKFIEILIDLVIVSRNGSLPISVAEQNIIFGSINRRAPTGPRNRGNSRKGKEPIDPFRYGPREREDKSNDESGTSTKQIVPTITITAPTPEELDVPEEKHPIPPSRRSKESSSGRSSSESNSPPIKSSGSKSSAKNQATASGSGTTTPVASSSAVDSGKGKTSIGRSKSVDSRNGKSPVRTRTGFWGVVQSMTLFRKNTDASKTTTNGTPRRNPITWKRTSRSISRERQPVLDVTTIPPRTPPAEPNFRTIAYDYLKVTPWQWNLPGRFVEQPPKSPPLPPIPSSDPSGSAAPDPPVKKKSNKYEYLAVLYKPWSEFFPYPEIHLYLLLLHFAVWYFGIHALLSGLGTFTLELAVTAGKSLAYLPMARKQEKIIVSGGYDRPYTRTTVKLDRVPPSPWNSGTMKTSKVKKSRKTPEVETRPESVRVINTVKPEKTERQHSNTPTRKFDPSSLDSVARGIGNSIIFIITGMLRFLFL